MDFEFEYDDFAIQQQGHGAELFDRPGNLRKAVRMILAVAREESDARAFFVGENPVAVVLLLVYPPWLLEWLGDERGQHGLGAKRDAVTHGCVLRAARGDRR